MTFVFAPASPATAGTTPTQETVVALHGSASAPSQWRHLAAGLQRDLTVVTPALPGYGDDHDQSTGRPQILAQIAKKIMQDVAVHADPVHLVGHSFGGAVALKMASMFPDKVRSLTLIEPAAFNVIWNSCGISTPKTARFNQTVRQSRVALKAGNATEAMAIFTDFWNGSGFWHRIGADQRPRMTRHATQIHDDFVALVSDRFTPADAARAGCPVLCISGDRSPVEIRDITSLLAQQLPCFHHETITGAGHMVPITHADIVTPMIGEFLAKAGNECQKYRCAA
ncbi:alpha/beta hydrolase [Roseobacter sp. YSTF-M11]|uniref:Alpha/beta hydrolase n=1 Tax=Roseobacter insulae TaxID=2859783 RepID=A0A9X1FZY5_9RHOB|nr:alpha/beta hydrolase [Roseobacter insulae]MBW4710003.1 alpha/beta hydrolase [Roseobacter insulae]